MISVSPEPTQSSLSLAFYRVTKRNAKRPPCFYLWAYAAVSLALTRLRLSRAM
jgi:hypothetical protein